MNRTLFALLPLLLSLGACARADLYKEPDCIENGDELRKRGQSLCDNEAQQAVVQVARGKYSRCFDTTEVAKGLNLAEAKVKFFFTSDIVLNENGTPTNRYGLYLSNDMKKPRDILVGASTLECRPELGQEYRLVPCTEPFHSQSTDSVELPTENEGSAETPPRPTRDTGVTRAVGACFEKSY